MYYVYILFKSQSNNYSLANKLTISEMTLIIRIRLMGVISRMVSYETIDQKGSRHLETWITFIRPITTSGFDG